MIMSDNGAGLFSDLAQYGITGGAGILGRIMYHVHLAQQGKRKPWLWTLCDVLLALGAGWVVLGLGDWFDVPFKAIQSLAILAGWGGPHMLDRLIIASLRKWSNDSTLTIDREP